jgi:hypothetical protein
MSGRVTLDEGLARRVGAALRDAEAWTAKYCADNHERVEPGMPYAAAVRALSRISDVRVEFEANFKTR